MIIYPKAMNKSSYKIENQLFINKVKEMLSNKMFQNWARFEIIPMYFKNINKRICQMNLSNNRSR